MSKHKIEPVILPDVFDPSTPLSELLPPTNEQNAVDDPSSKQPEPSPETGQRQPQKQPQTEPLDPDKDVDIGGGD